MRLGTLRLSYLLLLLVFYFIYSNSKDFRQPGKFKVLSTLVIILLSRRSSSTPGESCLTLQSAPSTGIHHNFVCENNI